MSWLLDTKFEVQAVRDILRRTSKAPLEAYIKEAIEGRRRSLPHRSLETAEVRQQRLSMSHILFVAPLALLLTSVIGPAFAQNPAAQDRAASVVQIDHIMFAISNIDDGIRQVEALTGIRPVLGGSHPGGRTQNALIALGPRQYLEILAPQAGAEVPEGLDLARVTPIGWASSTTDVAGTMAWLRSNGYETSTPRAGSRALPDGTILRWTTWGITDPNIVGAPFFIQWDVSSAHPATTSPGGCELHSLTITSPEREALSRLVNVLGLDVVVDGDPGSELAFEVELTCPNGTVSFN